MIRDGAPRGLVSNVMVLLAAVFSSTLAKGFLDSEILLPVYGQLLAAAGLLALIYQNRLFYIILLCLLALGAAVLSVRFVPAGNRLRNLAASFLLFSTLLALAGLPLLFSEPRGSRIVDDTLHPGLRKAVIGLFPRFPLLYGIPGFGFGYGTDRLGGTPILSEAPIFEIRGHPGQWLYLRTGAYDTYNSQSWSKLTIPAEIPSRTEDLIGDDLLLFRALGPEQVPAPSLQITILADYYTLLPFTLNTRAIYLPPEQIEGISGNFEEGYRLATPLHSGQSIYLLYGKNGSHGGEPVRALSAAETSEYLQLPGSLSPELRELAINLADAGGDPRSTLRNIERFLARNYTYNLEAERTPAGEDFVEGFLFQSKEGYCVHFASAFIVLARLNGIPARYTTGYLATVPAGSSPFEGMEEAGRGFVTGLSAHAWPEVWLEDRGWITWEATTAVNPSYYEEIGEQWLYEYDRKENRLTNRQLLSILGREPGSRQRRAPGFRGFNWQILLLVIPALTVLWIVVWTVRRYGILLVASIRPDRSSAMRMAAKIADSFHHRGVEWPHRLGWVRWIAGIGEAGPGSVPRAATAQTSHFQSRSHRLLDVVQRLVYSDQAFHRRDLEFIRLFYLVYCTGSRSRPKLAQRHTNRLQITRD
jgi:transglutaminase-like putative cysteine protease